MPHRGPYSSADLVNLTAEFSIGLAPYRVNSQLTRYIDPLRYYHCLNAGMEVVTTDIPQARLLADRLHVLHAPSEFAKLIMELGANAEARRNRDPGAHLAAWRERAESLMKIVEEHERANQRDTVR